MKFSVLIALYNNARFLDAVLSSVKHQSYNNLEVIIVDDGSTDDVNGVLRHHLSDSRIVYERSNQNKGCGAAKKRCVNLATGEIMGFLDPDDTLAHDAVQVMVEMHLRYPQAGLIHSTHHVCDEFLNPIRKAEYVKELPAGMPYLLLGDGRIHHFATFKKEKYLLTVGISEHLQRAVDQDLYYKMEETGPVIFVDQPLYYYRIHDRSISTQNNTDIAALANYAVMIDALKSRIQKADQQGNKKFKEIYARRLAKMNVFYWARRKNWGLCIYHLVLYPFRGGLQHMISYAARIPTQGVAILRKTFLSNYRIK